MASVNKFQTRVNFLLLIIVLLTTLFRLEPAVTKTFAFTYDVGRDMLALRDIVYNHHVSLIGPTTGMEGVFYGPWWYWILTPAFVLSSGDPVGIDIFMALSGVLTVIIAFLLGRKLLNSAFGLFLALCFALSPVLISDSSQIWNPNLTPFILVCIVLILFSLRQLKQKQNIGALFLLGLLSSLTFDSIEIVYGGIQLLATVCILIIFFRKQLTRYSVISFLFGVFLIEIPRLVFEVRHNFLMTHALFNNLLHSSDIQQHTTLQQIARYFDWLLHFWNYSWVIKYPLVGESLLLLFIVGLFASYAHLSQQERLFLKIAGVFFLMYLIVMSFYRSTIWDHFFVGFPVLLLSAGAIVYYNVLILIMRKFKMGKYAMLGVFVCFFLWKIYLILPSNHPVDTTDPSEYINQLGVVQHAYTVAHGRKFNYIVYTPPINPYTYEYLFSWYARNVSKQSTVKTAKLVFYIIEPDTNAGRRGQWVQEHANDGRIIQQEDLAGHITFQTRELK